MDGTIVGEHPTGIVEHGCLCKQLHRQPAGWGIINELSIGTSFCRISNDCLKKKCKYASVLWQPVLVTPRALPVGALQGWLCQDQRGCLNPSQNLPLSSWSLPTILEYPVQGERGVK